MLKFTIRVALAIACLSLTGLVPAGAQTNSAAAATNSSATNAPSATAPATPIALADVVAQAQAAATTVQDLQAGLDPDGALQAVKDELPKLTAQIDERNAEAARQPAGTAALGTLQGSQANWQSLSDSLADAQKNLSDRVRDLDQSLWKLSQMDATWKATLDSAQKAKAPSDVTNRINEIGVRIAAAAKAVQNHQAPLYAMQNRVAAQDARTKNGLDAVNKKLDAARQQLFEQNRPALWNRAAFAQPTGGIVIEEKASLDAQAAGVTIYLKAKIGAVLVHLLIFVVLLVGFFWMRNTIRSHLEKEPALEGAAHVFGAPIANAALLGLLAESWLYPGQPRLLEAAFGAMVLIPTVIVTRRLIDPASFPILYATVIAFLVDKMRYVVTPAGIVARFLFIFELLAAALFLLFALRLKHLSASAPNQTRLKRLTRLYLHVAFFVLVFAGLANVLGYIQLSILVGEGMLDSSYLAVILYAALRIVDALAISAMSIRPLSGLGMVRRHRDLLYAHATVGIRWFFFAVWFVASLQFFQQRDLVWQEINTLLWKDTYSWFNITFTLGAVLAFPITVWASFVISRFFRFVLEEEVYPHMSLGRGIPYAASAMFHYAILLLGFFAAVAATGAQLSQFAFLAGAFGVGLGFGLQNIMNNFVSGVILLFERPIKVGDIIQIDTNVGKVERIGIRASVILLSNGSELIVPNGNLISNPVTNWTLSNCDRLIEIPVSVASKADPQRVLSLLNEVARAHPSVLKNPSPQALLITLGAAGLSFRLRAWTDSQDEWLKITSDLSLAINAALARENIALS